MAAMYDRGNTYNLVVHQALSCITRVVHHCRRPSYPKIDDLDVKIDDFFVACLNRHLLEFDGLYEVKWMQVCTRIAVAIRKASG